MKNVDTDIMLSTLDNPYNPFASYREWESWDIRMGYKTNSYLARVALVADSIKPFEEEAAILRGIRDIILDDPSGQFIAIRRDGTHVSDAEMMGWLC